MKFTAVKSGLYIVSVNGVDVSKHTTEREAMESAVNRILPGVDVRYRHEYVVVVQAGVVSVSLSGEPMQLNGE